MCFQRYKHPFQPYCKEIKGNSNVINKNAGAGNSVADVTMRNHLAKVRGFSLRIPGNRRCESVSVNMTRCRWSPATPISSRTCLKSWRKLIQEREGHVMQIRVATITTMRRSDFDG